jgi:putative DNA primase/helicase
LVGADWTADADGVAGIVGALRFTERLYTLTRTNAGRTYAHRAARAAGNAAVVHPAFAQRALPADPDEADRAKLTDFNDLHKAEGLDVVRAQLAPEIERLMLSVQVRTIMREAAKESKPDTKPKPAKNKPQRPVDWGAFFDRFTFVYPTQTAWDAEIRKLVRLSDMRPAFGEAVVNTWLDSPQRKSVLLSQVVFDPGGKTGPPCINTFNGLALKPSGEASCERLIGLLRHLCGEAGQDQCPIMDWVLRWLAFPLQHPGAKMESALVMHGAAEGTGKNLFFRAVREIYGEYGSLITQSELESPYNAWLSQRLFIIANEVISRTEMRHHVGKLKNYITESPLPIRDLYMPLRYEDNHMNAVFLTNDLHALQIAPADRRYMVIWTPGGLTREYYDEVVAELAAGGAAALYQYLLDLELGDFDEHTKPPLTEAKENLIEQSYNSAQFFQVQLKAGEIGDAPYGPCLVRDLYELYLAWCPRVGHRNPVPLNRFSHEFMAMNGVKRVEKARVIDPERAEERLMTPSERRGKRGILKHKALFVMGVRPESK